MKRILVTGATGNIGAEVVHYLCQLAESAEIIAAVRKIDKAQKRFSQYSKLVYRRFDFGNQDSFQGAFNEIDILFLLRPPHIADVEKYFKPLLLAAKTSGIEKIVFLSVQGAEKSKVIPHNKIERLIKSLGFAHIFVRPSYFMQNLSTTLLPEIHTSQTITLPSGKAKFNWVHVGNIGEAAAVLLLSFDTYQNQAYEITGTENKSFEEVTSLMSEIIGSPFYFKSINPISFYFRKRKEGLQSDFALVMTMLHFLPRLQDEPEISTNYTMLTGKNPTSLREFIESEKNAFLP